MNERERFFRIFLRRMPLSLALWRSFEAEKFAGVPMTGPTLDVGCGDGLFASLVFGEPFSAGVDLDPGEVSRARAGGFYGEVHCASADAMPLESGRFRTVVSNCVLEHIPQIDKALAEISRVLAPGGKVYFTVHTEHYGPSLLGGRFFRAIGLRALGDAYVRFVNGVFKHYNMNHHSVWEERLRRVGLRPVSFEYFIPPAVLGRHERWFLPAVPAKISKMLTGRWVWMPRGCVARVAPAWFRPALETKETGGVCYFITAEKA